MPTNRQRLQGDFHITYAATNPAPAKPVSIGGNRSVSAAALFMTSVNNAGSGLLHTMTGRCASLFTADAAAKTMENVGYCDYADADGDHVFERFTYPVQALAPNTHAKGEWLGGEGEWLGGAGNFAGIAGQFDIDSTRLVSQTERAVQVIGEGVGRYTIQKEPASK